MRPNTILHAPRLFDGTGSLVSHGVVVEIQGAVIGRVVTSSGEIAKILREARDSGAAVVDLPDCTLLPGLVNAHEHLDDRRSFGTFSERMARPSSLLLLEGVRGCLASLEEGITAVRDLGSRYWNNVWLKRAIDLGIILGPRIVSCGRPIAPTGGYGLPLSIEADGGPAVTAAARSVVRGGADIVKVMASGGLAGAASPQFTEGELKAIFDVAKQASLRSTVHANPADVIARCVRAGVDCIEHGRGLDDATARIMADHGTWMVPTLSELVVLEHEGQRFGRRASQVAGVAATRSMLLRGLEAALKAGVRVGVGLDVMGTMPLELKLMVDAGMSTSDVLVAATLHGAELLGLASEIGSVRPGKRADLVAVRGNPVASIEDIGHIELVVLDGHVWPAATLKRLVGTQITRWNEEHGRIFAEATPRGEPA
jgi:imidazolonepropionase-like amidohydrolase